MTVAEDDVATTAQLPRSFHPSAWRWIQTLEKERRVTIVVVVTYLWILSMERNAKGKVITKGEERLRWDVYWSVIKQFNFAHWIEILLNKKWGSIPMWWRCCSCWCWCICCWSCWWRCCCCCCCCWITRRVSSLYIVPFPKISKLKIVYSSI